MKIRLVTVFDSAILKLKGGDNNLKDRERVRLLKVKMLEGGEKYTQIAERVGCTRQYVGKVAREGVGELPCKVRRELAKLAGVTCAEMWCNNNTKVKEKGRVCNQ